MNKKVTNEQIQQWHEIFRFANNEIVLNGQISKFNYKQNLGNMRRTFSYSLRIELDNWLNKINSEGYKVVDFDIYSDYWRKGEHKAEFTFEKRE